MRLEEEKEERRKGILALSASPWPRSEWKVWAERYWGSRNSLRGSESRRLFLSQVPADDTGSSRHKRMGVVILLFLVLSSSWCPHPKPQEYSSAISRAASIPNLGPPPNPLLLFEMYPQLHLHSPPLAAVPQLALPLSENGTTVHETTGLVHVFSPLLLT